MNLENRNWPTLQPISIHPVRFEGVSFSNLLLYVGKNMQAATWVQKLQTLQDGFVHTIERLLCRVRVPNKRVLLGRQSCIWLRPAIHAARQMYLTQIVNDGCLSDPQWVNQLYPTRMLRADGQCDTVNEHTWQSIIVDLMVYIVRKVSDLHIYYHLWKNSLFFAVCFHLF